MIHHAVSMVAVFVGQMAQAPVQIQCVQAVGQDPLWARLFVAAIPSIFALGIAWLVFRWNRKREHKQWVLDNKKIEWRALLELASKVEQFMPSVAIGGELTKTVHDPSFREHLREMTQTVLKCVFISKIKAEKIYNSLINVQLVNEQSKGHIEDHNSNAYLAQALGKPRPLEAAQNVQSELIVLWREIRQFASEDMDLEHQKQWWKSLVDRLQKPRKPIVDSKTFQNDPPDAP
jgi:hypothetical protein